MNATLGFSLRSQSTTAGMLTLPDEMPVDFTGASDTQIQFDGLQSSLTYFGVIDSIPGNTSTTQTLAIGSSVTATISPETDQDWFRITLNAGSTYTFSLNGSGSSPLNDPFIYLYNSSGNLVTYDDDSGPGYNSRITYTPSTSGTYYLGAAAYQASNYDNMGQYTMSASAGGSALPTYSLAQIADYLKNRYWTEFAGTTPHYYATNTITYNLTGLTAAAQTLARQALQDWHDVCNLTFVETTGSAQITFDDNHSGAYTSSNYSSGVISSSFVNVGLDWLNAYGTAIDSYTMQTYIHEIGHALGLGHAGPYNGSATYGVDNIYANDSWTYSIMSYFDQAESGYGSYRFVMTPQLADIVATQAFYGVATTTRTGDTVYGFNSNAGQIYNFANYTTAPALTIYDSSGTDTLDCSGYFAAQTINLTGGTFSSVGGLSNNIAIAANAVIENTIGGSGNDTITGSDANNFLSGGAGADTLSGGAGADILSGGAGRDTLLGGAGFDTARYGSYSNTATWTYNANGSWTVTSSDGTDTLQGMELLDFNDRNVALWKLGGVDLSGDFNGDGRNDILWRNDTGQVATWDLLGSGYSAHSQPTQDFSWMAQGVGDFNGDGRDDILWHDQNGNVLLWFMNDTYVSSGSPGSAGLSWNIQTVGDFNGDGRDDILWRNVNGDVFSWQLNGATLTAGNLLGTAAPEWSVQGVGDFNGDGRDDILWRNTNGATFEWLMNGSTIIGTGSPGTAASSWSIRGIGDFNGDGHDDILWHNTNGSTFEWLMNGTSIIGTGSPGTAANTWEIQNVGDYNNDGRADILWRHDDGTTFIWYLNGTSLASTSNLGSPGTDWHLV